MMFRPFSFLMQFTLRRLVRITLGANVNPNFIPLLASLYTFTNTLITTIGILPTLRVLRTIRQVITSPTAVLDMSRVIEGVLTATRLTRSQVLTIIKTITPLLEECIKIPTTFGKFLKYFKYIFLFSSISPLIKWGFRQSLGILLSSVGILWNETLSSITILKELSENIVDCFEYQTGIRIPRNGISSTEIEISDENKEILETMNNSSPYLELFGLVLTGVVVSLVGLFVLDYFYPETVQQVPYVNTFVDNVHSFFNYLFNRTAVVEPNPAASPNTLGQNINLPEAISRSSSGSSTSTVTPSSYQDITPPRTPEPEVFIQREYGSVVPNNWE